MLQKSIRVTKAFLVTLILLLVFIPVNTLANVVESKITYVSLGDSLAANQLSDKTFGKGYVENIKSDLTENGYEVYLENLGVSGYKTTDVINDLKEDTILAKLANADIITLSIGANDILAELNPSLLDGLDLAYSNETYVHSLLNEAMQPLINSLNEVDASIDTSIAHMQEMKQIIEKVQENENNLSDEIKDFLQNTLLDIEAIETHLTDAKSKVSDAKDALHAGNISEEIVEDSLHDLNKANIKLNTLRENIEVVTSNLENSETPISPDIESAISDINQKTLTALASVNKSIEKSNATSNVFITYVETVREIQNKVNQVREAFQMLEALPTKINEVGGNIGQILGTIRAINSDARIYVLGYYNALPYLDEALTKELLAGLNKAIQLPTESMDGIFVPTAHLFDGKYDEYLDNQPDIHPNEAGYRAIANAFMQKINESFPPIPKPIEPEEPEEPKKPEEPKEPVEKPTDVTKPKVDNNKVNGNIDHKKPKNTTEKYVATTEVEKGSENNLPKTATNNYNLLIIGAILLSIGFITYIRYRHSYKIY